MLPIPVMYLTLRVLANKALFLYGRAGDYFLFCAPHNFLSNQVKKLTSRMRVQQYPAAHAHN
jgi:hypothetical protein